MTREQLVDAVVAAARAWADELRIDSQAEDALLRALDSLDEAASLAAIAAAAGA